MQKKIAYLIPLLFALILAGCTTTDLYEKTVTIPKHAWQSTFQPSFNFTIKDTSSLYNISVVMRHSEKYNYNNLYLNLHIKAPGSDTVNTIKGSLVLATNEEWLGAGMNDIYEVQLPVARNFRFPSSGEHIFTLQQIMRDDPLNDVLDIGLRIEKAE